MDPILLTVHICAFGSVGLAAYAVASMILAFRQRRRMVREEIIVTETRSELIRLLLPLMREIGLAIRAVLAPEGRLPENDPTRPDTQTRPDNAYLSMLARVRTSLAAAGQPEGINADEFIGMRVLGALGGAGLGVVAEMLLEVGPVLAIGSGLLLGWLYPGRWVKRKMRSRQESIRRTLPFALDMLTLATEAGLDFTSALDRIVRKLGRDPLGDEFGYMLREIQLGRTRSEALRDLARRIDMTDVTSVVSSLIQAEELGASIGPMLRIQAGQQRERRSQRAEKLAMEAPVKMLFPLVAFIFPMVFVVIFAPLAIRFFL